MLIPEVILMYTVKSLIDVINKDWTDNTDPTKTILYDLFYKDDNGYPLVLNKFNYFEQAKNLFITDKNKQRQLVVTMGYNLERKGLPTIHILLPDEQQDEVTVDVISTLERIGAAYLKKDKDTPPPVSNDRSIPLHQSVDPTTLNFE